MPYKDYLLMNALLMITYKDYLLMNALLMNLLKITY